ncbi:MAG: S8 family serine peptidase [Sideroxyarcus sp.]
MRTTIPAGTYTSSTGTSFSAPIVSGAVAILKSCGVPLDQIESTLRNSANVMVPFPDGSSAPRLDIYRALHSRNVVPTAVNLSNNRLGENTDTSAGVEVGTLTATDLDTCDKHSYSIVGGADATKFSIGGAASDRLRLSDGVLHYAAKPNYSVTVRVSDFFGATYEQALTVSVGIPPAAPTNLHVVVQ